MWRIAHLWFSIVITFFLVTVSVTGVVLAIEPIYMASSLPDASDPPTLEEFIPILKTTYDEVLGLYHDSYGTTWVEVYHQGASQKLVIDPDTGEALGKLTPRLELFTFCRNLHRSLFAGQIGRFIVGVSSIILLLVVISGIGMVVRMQGGFTSFFKSSNSNDFYRDNHLRFTRWLLLPILLIALSGTYLFADRFGIESTNFSQQDVQEHHAFNVLGDYRVTDIEGLVFPFSDDEEEYYELHLPNSDLLVHQYTGSIASQLNDHRMATVARWSYIVHTGEGYPWWAAILGLCAVALLFFNFSGLMIYFKRKENKLSNAYAPQECEYIILTGTEHGTTARQANRLYHSLMDAGCKVFICSMNDYVLFDKMKHLVVFTSTYGAGDPPASADQFIRRLSTNPPKSRFEYAVLGFGSSLYPDFCHYAYDVDQQLSSIANASPKMSIQTIDEFKNEQIDSWVGSWSDNMNLSLALTGDNDQIQYKSYRVLSKEHSPNFENDQTFLIRIAPADANEKIISGDLLAVKLGKDQVDRYYSIAYIDRQIVLSVRRHAQGACSNYLFSLEQGDMITGYIKQNPDFYLNTESSEPVTMIANGTGIAPFLGMISNNTQRREIILYWGGKSILSEKLYREILDKAMQEGKLSKLIIAHSREGKSSKYVQDVLAVERDQLTDHISANGHVMLCGAIAMQQACDQVINEVLDHKLMMSIDDLKSLGRYKSDCY